MPLFQIIKLPYTIATALNALKLSFTTILLLKELKIVGNGAPLYMIF